MLPFTNPLYGQRLAPAPTIAPTGAKDAALLLGYCDLLILSDEGEKSPPLNRALDGIRTHDRLLTKKVLYLLSYEGI